MKKTLELSKKPNRAKPGLIVNIARIAKRCPENITLVVKCVKFLFPKVQTKFLVRAKQKFGVNFGPKTEVLPYNVVKFLLIFELQFFFSKINMLYFCQRLQNLLNFSFKAILKMDDRIKSFPISNYILQLNLFLQTKFFYKHLHLVISQLLYKIFQPFKEQNWCPSLGAPNFGANSECFAQLLRIWSKTPNFWVTENSEYNESFK